MDQPTGVGWTMQNELKSDSSQRHLREKFRCKQLAGPEDVLRGHQWGPGSRRRGPGLITGGENEALRATRGNADYIAVGVGDIDNSGHKSAIAGHQSNSSLDVFNYTGLPADPSYTAYRYQALRNYNGVPAAIIVDDFDQNGLGDILVFGTPNAMFLQAIVS